jgi:outer membrane protein
MRLRRRRIDLLGLAAVCFCAMPAASCTLVRPVGESSLAARPGAPRPADGTAAALRKPAAADKTPAKADKARGPQAAEPSGPVELTVSKAVLTAIENNRQLVVERIGPQIVRTGEQLEQGVFDPRLTGSIGYFRELGMGINSSGELFNSTENSLIGDIGIAQLLPTGTAISLGVKTSVVDTSGLGSSPAFPRRPGLLGQLVETRAGLTVTQALLRGAGTSVNLARIREARLDTLASDYELRGFAVAVVACVEQTYWDLVLAGRTVEILQQAVAMAEDEFRQLKERIGAGTVAGMNLTAAEAETALRRDELVDARSEMAKTRVRLLRLLNLPGGDLWSREVQLVDRPSAAVVALDDVESHVQVALRMRPDLNQTRLGIQRGDLEVVRTANGLLPRLDLFVTLGQSGYAETFGGSWGNIDGSRHEVLVGMRAEYPIGQHTDRAWHGRAVLTRRQAEEAVKNLEQLVQEDVRTAYLEVRRTQEKASTAAAACRLDEQKLRAEMELALLGKSSAFQVARAQRDLVRTRLAEAAAVVGQMKAVVDLYRLEGSLLDRRGVSAPGGSPPASGFVGH